MELNGHYANLFSLQEVGYTKRDGRELITHPVAQFSAAQ